MALWDGATPSQRRCCCRCRCCAADGLSRHRWRWEQRRAQQGGTVAKGQCGFLIHVSSPYSAGPLGKARRRGKRRSGVERCVLLSCKLATRLLALRALCATVLLLLPSLAAFFLATLPEESKNNFNWNYESRQITHAQSSLPPLPHCLARFISILTFVLFHFTWVFIIIILFISAAAKLSF